MKQRNPFLSFFGYGILGLLSVSVLLAFLWLFPKFQVYQLMHHAHQAVPDLSTQFTLEDKARQTLAAILGGIFILINAIVGIRNLRVAERNAEISQRKLDADQAAAAKNAEIANDKQLTDRFTAAVTNLGSSNLAQRLGGIYALERIADQSLRDHWAVMEVLTATIRDKRKRPYEEDEGGWTDDRLESLPTDIRAILTVIGRRNADQDQGRQLILRATELSGADLSGADLTGGDLSYANLSWVNLSGTNLSQADLSHAVLYRANLSQADLSGADLSMAELHETNLSGVKGLTHDQLCSSRMEVATLKGYLDQPEPDQPSPSDS